MSNDAIPFFEDGDELTCTVITAAVVGKTLVKIAGDMQADGTFTVATCGSADRPLGVAMWDAAVGARVTVHTIESHHCMPITLASNVAAGQAVKPAAAGKVTLATALDVNAIGVAATGALAAADGMILLGRQTA